MSNEIKTIHQFDFSLICEYFSSVERQGPGSPEMTIKALSFIHNLPPQSCIADVGCGTGGQTMVLAQNASGQITVVASIRNLLYINEVQGERTKLVTI